VFNFSEDATIPSGGTKAKNRAMDVLTVVLRALELDIGDGEVGTHSIRKCASTHVKINGVSKDDKDTRGRWKATGRVSDQYDSVKLPYVDTKVAVSLCTGGTCSYNLSEAIPHQFILEHVAPEINNQYGSQVALVLGAPLMWVCFDASVSHLVPLFIKDRVLSAYAQVGLPEGYDLVQRRLVIVTGDNENVSLTQLTREEEATRRRGEGGGALAGTARNMIAALMSQMRQYETQMEQMRQEAEIHRNQVRSLMERNHRNTNENLRRIVIAPARVVGQSTATAMTAAATTQMVNNHLGDPKAVLSPNPRSLHFIWEEWITGLNGNKPASQFTREERGKTSARSAGKRSSGIRLEI
jgi:hypothetical protein